MQAKPPQYDASAGYTLEFLERLSVRSRLWADVLGTPLRRSGAPLAFPDRAQSGYLLLLRWITGRAARRRLRSQNVALSSFDAADVVAVQPSSLGRVLLRQAQRDPKFTHATAKRRAGVVVSGGGWHCSKDAVDTAPTGLHTMSVMTRTLRQHAT